MKTKLPASQRTAQPAGCTMSCRASCVWWNWLVNFHRLVIIILDAPLTCNRPAAAPPETKKRTPRMFSFLYVRFGVFKWDLTIRDFWSNLFCQPYLHEVTTDWKEKPFLAFFLGWTVAKAVSRLEYSKPRQKRNYTIDLYLRRPQIDRFGKSVIPVNIEQNNCRCCECGIFPLLKMLQIIILKINAKSNKTLRDRSRLYRSPTLQESSN